MHLQFDNRFTRALAQDPNPANERRQVHGALWSAVVPTPCTAPRLIAASPDMLTTLGLSEADAQSAMFAQVFAGNRLLPGMQPYASNYGGHQFGHWAGQLGDGRAITLGEALGADGQHWALQLKGAGVTPYSRRGDGRAVLRSSIREFLCSEAMHHLGIPTTRALSLVATGDAVVRDMFYNGHPRPEPGAIVCRAAPSFTRFGHFELPSARGDTALLRQLADFCIETNFPHLAGRNDRYAAWFAEVAQRTATLIAEWMRTGFVHGVMNTDNLSITGLTIDYGPYGWLDDYDPHFTPNTSDTQRRYCFGNQPQIGYWNLQQLAIALSPLFDDVEPLNAALELYAHTYAQAEQTNACRKLGLPADRPDMPAQALELMRRLQAWMHAAEMDMTLVFRTLSDQAAASLAPGTFSANSYSQAQFTAHEATLANWLHDYRALLAASGQSEEARQQLCRQANPRFILRNWIAQQAIEQAEQGDESAIHTLLKLLRNPYQTQTGDAPYIARRPEWARMKPGCSMLSCSS